MARYNRKYYKRRNYRRKSLSASRIFGKTSAKSQAKQIYALRNHVSRINRKLRPDIKILSGSPRVYTFSSSALSSIWDSVGVLQPNTGDANNQRIGDKIYEKSLQVQMYAEYYNSSDTGYHNSESSGATVRVFVVQHKAKGSPTDTFDLSTFLEEPGIIGGAYNILAVKPFAPNITQDWRILYNKAFTLTSARNQHLLKFSVKPGLIRFDADDKHNFLKVYTVVSGLHYDQNFTEYVQTTVNVKLVYTDI